MNFYDISSLNDEDCFRRCLSESGHLTFKSEWEITVHIQHFRSGRFIFHSILRSKNGINCAGHTSPTPVLLPIFSLTLSKWFKIYFLKVKLSVRFHEVKWFPKRTLERILLLWSEEDISTKLITSSFPTVGSVLLVTKSTIWPVPLNVLWKGMSAKHFHLSLPRHSLIHPICNVSFTHWFSFFSGKWES